MKNDIISFNRKITLKNLYTSNELAQIYKDLLKGRSNVHQRTLFDTNEYTVNKKKEKTKK